MTTLPIVYHLEDFKFAQFSQTYHTTSRKEEYKKTSHNVVKSRFKLQSYVPLSGSSTKNMPHACMVKIPKTRPSDNYSSTLVIFFLALQMLHKVPFQSPSLSIQGKVFCLILIYPPMASYTCILSSIITLYMLYTQTLV